MANKNPLAVTFKPPIECSTNTAVSITPFANSAAEANLFGWTKYADGSAGVLVRDGNGNPVQGLYDNNWCETGTGNSNTGNVLPDEDCSFEGGTVGNWKGEGAGGYQCTLANDALNGYHGSHSLKMTTTVAGRAYAWLVATALTSASTEYTLACKFKAPVGITMHVWLYDNGTGGAQDGATIVADGTWQTATVTATFGDGATRALGLETDDGALGDIVYWDSIILKAGASATPPSNLVVTKAAVAGAKHYLTGFVASGDRPDGLITVKDGTTTKYQCRIG